LEFKKGNTFGTVAFSSYGSFWLTLVGIWVFPKLGIMAAPEPVAMGWYLFMWGLLTFGLFCGTLRGALIGKLVFGSLTVLFVLLAAANFLYLFNTEFKTRIYLSDSITQASIYWMSDMVS
jgi:succinate-acetate transporter protein